MSITETKSNVSLENNKLGNSEQYRFYELPKYYDLVFKRNIDNDFEFFRSIFRLYCNFDVKRIIEPACGSGIFIEKFANHGYYIKGYDISKKMIKYCDQRLQKNIEIRNNYKVITGDMRNKIFKKESDAAFICINSLGYLRTDEDIISHFKTMNKSLRDGGIYIAEISCKCENIQNEIKKDDIWYIKEDNIDIKAQWIIKRYDIEKKIREIDFQMTIRENGKKKEIKEIHNLRLWTFEDFKQLTSLGGFSLIGIYNQNYESVSELSEINGELGALYFILKNNKTKSSE
ncbi:MAG: class I SAM-dependent methyltransferase [Candidatus Lokiarchaeota archaeon]|nr:class I SAM-dependent methyltransferase [Candidatus Lokiarchaeota archaeon]